MEAYARTPADKQKDIPLDRGTLERIAYAMDTLATKKRMPDLAHLIESFPGTEEIGIVEETYERLSRR